MSGGKCSSDENVHVELMSKDAREIGSWPVEGELGTRRTSKLLYAVGSTPTEFKQLYPLYKKYKATAGTDAVPFSSWYEERLLKKFEE